VIAAHPDVIIGSWCGKPVRKERIAARAGWDQIPAVRQGAIHEVKSTYILQPGPASLTEGVTQVHRILAEWEARLSD
jgi:iron complex transport system substrate-binding protein